MWNTHGMASYAITIHSYVYVRPWMHFYSTTDIPKYAHENTMVSIIQRFCSTVIPSFPHVHAYTYTPTQHTTNQPFCSACIYKLMCAILTHIATYHCTYSEKEKT